MKIITDYEVEGEWGVSTTKSKCRLCGAKLQPVPKENHFNSKYWKLQRDDGMFLICCPKGCDVKEAEKRMKKFNKIRGYCTNKSNSWNYELDYANINDGWINKHGVLYPCGCRQHIDLAFELNSDEQGLENEGWLKLSSQEFFWCKKLSNQQIDFIFDYIMIVGTKRDVKNLKDEIDNPTGYFKIGGLK